MKDIQYNIVNTRIRTFEDQLLKSDVYERMLTAESGEEVFNLLQDTPYGDFMNEETSVYEFEAVLNAEQKRMYETLYAISPNRLVIDLSTLRYDYQNLKVLVKEKYTKEDLSSLLLPFGSTPLSELTDLVENRSNPNVHEQMNACIQEVFQYIEDYHEHHAIDIIFDNHYWQHMCAISKEESRGDISEIVKRNIDIFNISTILRSHFMGRHLGFISAVLAEGGRLPVDNLIDSIGQSLDDFVEYLKGTPYKKLIEISYEEFINEKTLNSFDIRKDNFMMGKLKERKIVPFGPTAIIGYIYAKEIEIKNLRILLVGKINHLPEKTLRSRVRDIYV